MKNKSLGYSLLVIFAGIFWGTMGIFVKMLTEYGFSSLHITAIRFLVGVACLGVLMLIYDRKLFKVSLKGLLLCVITGIFSSFLMSWLYFVSINETSLSAAAILLYTAPIWVMIASVVIYKESFNSKKLIALVLSFLGCVFVSGFSSGTVSVLGIFCGLVSGFAYALYSIIGKYTLKLCSPITITFYSFLTGGLCAFLASDIGGFAEIIHNEFDSILLPKMLGTGFISMFIPFTLYTIGLSKLPAGKASVMATVEPVTATVCGIILYNEVPRALGFVGIGLIFVAVILLNLKKE